MKLMGLLLASLMLISCSQGKVEELAFRKTLEYKLVELCGKEDKACIAAVKAQVSPCMEKSRWRQYLQHQNDQAEFDRFTREFYACIVDADGHPYFETK